MANTDVAQVLAGIKNLIANPPEDKAVRRELYESLKSLSTVIEHPDDTIYRVCYSPVVLSVGVTASDLNIFELLSKSEKPLSVSSLAETSKCDPVLMGRILRYLASQQMVTEVDEDTFTANPVTNTLARPGFAAGMRHNLESHMPSLSVMPKFLKDTKYANPSDVMNSAFQIGHKTDLPAFVWGAQKPEMMQDFMMWMGAVYGDRPTTFLDAFDMSKHCAGATAEDVVFVDVGGSVGHQCALLKGKLPDLKGRVVLEDLPQVVPQAIPIPGLEAVGLDMWQGQPIKGAKTYYMRMILHDYPDSKAIQLLKLQAEAMTPDSVLIIDELIVPNKGAHSQATQFDMTMMASLSSIERTDREWDALIKEAGFKIVEKKAYAPAGESVIVIKPVA